MISVCIATHNGEKYIKEQLLSILPQLDSMDEIVISDDGSTDKTLEIVKSLEDYRIKIFEIISLKNKTPHYNVTRNFENALKHTSGDIIFLADQDDVWYPNKVSVCLSALKSAVAILHNLECVDAEIRPLGYTWYNEKLKFRAFNIFMLKGKHMGCALVFRRELLKFILPFPQSLCLHDFWIGIVSEFKGGLKYIEEPLIYYRIHSNNTSGFAQRENSVFFKVYYRLYTMINCIVRVLFR